MLPNRRGVRASFSGVPFLFASPRVRGDGAPVAPKDLGLYLNRYHLETVRPNGTLGTEVAGPAVNVDIAGLKALPRPMLVWGTAEGFARRPFTTLGFIEAALRLRGLCGWDHDQQAAVRELIRWFFRRSKGPAWVSVLPYKPKSDHQVQRQGGSTQRHVGPPPDRWGRNPTSVRLRGGLPNLPLRGFNFVYGTGNENVQAELFGVSRSRTVDVPWRGFERRRDEYILCMGHPGLDDLLMPARGDVATERVFYSEEAKLYTNIHIWLCKLPQSAFNARDRTFCNVSRMGVKVHPGDGRVHNLHFGRQPLALLLEGQVLERSMLERVGVIRV